MVLKSSEEEEVHEVLPKDIPNNNNNYKVSRKFKSTYANNLWRKCVDVKVDDLDVSEVLSPPYFLVKHQVSC